METEGQGHHPEAQMERKAWSHMGMVLLTRARCEILGPLVFLCTVVIFYELGALILELHLLLCLHAGICGCQYAMFYFFVDSNDMLKDSNARISKTVLVKLGCGPGGGVITVFGGTGIREYSYIIVCHVFGSTII